MSAKVPLTMDALAAASEQTDSLEIFDSLKSCRLDSFIESPLRHDTGYKAPYWASCERSHPQTTGCALKLGSAI